ncbi:hypothetical protein M011DRAFT_471688 [Sporormia fimetaria CBS 119925]|uniref:Uncharacterized protein n=1 Tax=Sporormia fimetaria CBS 119925 TaxID=1340428 RepID=A0A6A6V0H3_9PLEO|nr:hypothetical protein M011DRAFT_471688 [Sporormia fimetaria CBS 119925]
MYEEKPAVFFSQPSVDAAYRYGLSRGQPPPYSYGQPQMQSPQNSYGQIQLQPPQNSYGQIQLQPPQNSYGQIQLQPPQNSYGPTHMQPPQTPYGPTHMQPPQPPYGPTHMQPPRIFYGEAQMPPPQYPYDQTQMQPRRYSHDQTQMPPSQYLYDQTQMQPRRYSYDQAQMPPRQYSYDQLQSLAPSSIQTVPTFAPSRRASRRSISSTQHLAGPPAPGLTQLLAPPPNSAAGFPQTGPQINPQAFDASLASPTSAILDDDLLLPQFAQAPVRHAAHGYTHAPGLTSAARTAYTSDAAHVPSPAGPQYVPGRVATDPYQWPEHQWPLPTPDQMHAALNELDWRGTPARLLAASFAGVVRRGTKAQFLAMITEMGGAYLDDVDMVFNLQ